MSFDILKLSVGNNIDTKMAIFIYETVCTTDVTDDDIESIKDYEAGTDEGKRGAIDELIIACKMFKARYILLQQELPKPHEVKFTSARVPGKINPKFTLVELTKDEITTNKLARSQQPDIDQDDDLDDDVDPTLP